MIWNAFRPAIASWFHSISITLRSVRGPVMGNGGTENSKNKMHERTKKRRESKILSNHKTFLIQKESCLHSRHTGNSQSVAPLFFRHIADNCSTVGGDVRADVLCTAPWFSTPFHPMYTHGGAASAGRGGIFLPRDLKRQGTHFFSF